MESNEKKKEPQDKDTIQNTKQNTGGLGNKNPVENRLISGYTCYSHAGSF